MEDLWPRLAEWYYAHQGPAIVISLVVVLLVTYMLSAPTSRQGAEKHLPRTMSFTSAACAEGAFPDWVNMSAPIINAAVILKEAPEREALAKTIEQLFHYERFRSRKVKVGGQWAWQEMEEYSADSYIFTETLRGDEKALFERLEQWALKPLQVPEGNGEFEFVLIKNTGSGPSAVIARVNHAIGDGISLAKLIPVVFRDMEGKPLPPPERYTRKEPNFKPSLRNPFKILSCLIKVIGTPNSPYDTDVGLMEKERKTLKFSGRRKLIRLPDLPLSYIKAIKNAAGVTVNDVIYSATAGAFHRYGVESACASLLDKDSASNVHTRALLPVALPRQITDPARALRNKWSFASAPIPVGIKDPLERLKTTHNSLQQFKDSPIVVVQNVFEGIVGNRLPWKLNQQIAHDTFTRHTLVFSNVPGPDYPVRFAGKEVIGLYQIFANLLPQVGAMSLNGKIHMCMMVDDQVVKNPIRLSHHFLEDLATLAKELKVPVPPGLSS